MTITATRVSPELAAAGIWPRDLASRCVESSPGRASAKPSPETAGATRTGEGSRDSAQLAQWEGLKLAQKLADESNRSLRFHVDDASGRVAAEVVDRKTGEVIRQIPPEEILRLAARMNEVIELIFGERERDPAEMVREPSLDARP